MRTSMVMASLIMLGAACSAAAQSQRTFSAQAKADEQIVARNYASWNRQCQSNGLPTIMVAVAPTHGTLETVPTRVRVETTVPGGEQCIGQMMDGLRVLYRPRAGYRGSDQFELTVTFRSGASTRDVFNVSVN